MYKYIADDVTFCRHQRNWFNEDETYQRDGLLTMWPFVWHQRDGTVCLAPTRWLTNDMTYFALEPDSRSYR